MQCDSELDGKTISTTISIDACRDPPKVDITVDCFGVYFDQTFKESTDIAIPGLTIGGVGVFLHVQMDNSDVDVGSLDLKV